VLGCGIRVGSVRVSVMVRIRVKVRVSLFAISKCRGYL